MRRFAASLLLLCAFFALLAVACADGGGAPAPSDDNSGGGGGGGGGGGPLAISTSTLPTTVTGIPYSQALKAFGGTGTYSWTIAGGALASGLTLSGNGVIGGAATVTGNWPVKIVVHDGVTTASRSYLLSVTAPTGDPSVESSLRSVLANLNVSGLGPQHVPQLNPAQVDLGRLLFFDKELSGIRDMACATCHHPSLTTGDGLNLSVGVGGVGGIGPGRTHPAKLFIARNAPPLFNLGTVRQLFWDMRVSAPPIGTPGSDVTSTPEGPMNLPPLVAQALLPLADITEMRGTGHALDGLTSDQYRNALLQRLMQIPGYVQRFNSAFGAGGMTVENIGRAIAAYELSQTFVNSPYDRYLRGENDALTDSQKNGALVFFGRALCSTCHAGPELTNVTVHNLGIPQFGPGQGNGPSGREDFGSENVTGDSNERYAFRVPPLRNVAFTAPYMHNGAFETLEEVIQHYNDKEISTAAFTGQNMTQAADLAPTLLPHTPFVQNMSISFTVIPNDLTQQEKDDLVQFLLALTDPQAINRTQEVPQTVPSGQPVDR